MGYSDKDEIHVRKDTSFSAKNDQGGIRNNTYNNENNDKEKVNGKKDKKFPAQNEQGITNNGQSDYTNRKENNGKKKVNSSNKILANKLPRKKKENEKESMEYLYKNYSLFCEIYSLLGIIAIIILSINNILTLAEIDRGKFTNSDPARYKSEPVSNNPKNLINDQGKILTDLDSVSNDQDNLSQKAKGVRCKSESISTNPEKSEPVTNNTDNLINDQGKLLT